MSNTPANWEVHQTEHYNDATHRMPGYTTELYLDDEALVVEADHGFGVYSREHTTTSIPISVIVAMLRHAGYSVQTPEELAQARARQHAQSEDLVHFSL